MPFAASPYLELSELSAERRVHRVAARIVKTATVSGDSGAMDVRQRKTGLVSLIIRGLWLYIYVPVAINYFIQYFLCFPTILRKSLHKNQPCISD